MECSTFAVKSDQTNLTLLVIYKKPTSSTITFCEELTTILEEGITSMKSNIMIIGNFNIHIENTANLIRSSQSPTTMTSSEKTNKVTKPSSISQTVYLVKVTIFPYHQPETWNPWLKIAVCFLVTKLAW